MNAQNDPAVLSLVRQYSFTGLTGDGTLTDTALLLAFARPRGAHGIMITGTWHEVAASGASISLTLYGSNDNTNWNVILADPTVYSGATDIDFLFGSSASIDVARWHYLKLVATAVAPGAFTCAFDYVSFPGTGQNYIVTQATVRTADPTAGLTLKRVQGVRGIMAQVVVTNFVTGVGAHVHGYLQISIDGSVWINYSDLINITGNGVYVVTQNAINIVDLGQAVYFRFRFADTGGLMTSYTATAHVSFDNTDWFAADAIVGGSPSLPTILNQSLLRVTLATTPVDATHVEVTATVTNFDGTAHAEAVELLVTLYDTTLAPIDLATNAQYSSISVGTLVYTGVNRFLITTNASGVATFRIIDAVAEDTFAMAEVVSLNATRVSVYSNQVTIDLTP